MNEQQKKKVQLVKKLVNKWKDHLEVTYWDIQVRIEDEGNGDVAAESKPNTRYNYVTLIFFPRFFELSKTLQEEVVVHELCHCITKDYSRLVERQFNSQVVSHDEEHDTNERATSWIARIALKSL